MNQNRVALVIGVGPGLGASLARRFARGGFAVGLAARRSTFIDDLTREIANGGGNAIALVADVSRPAEIRSAAERVRLRAEVAALSAAIRAEKLGDVASEFDQIHSVERALEMGSISAIIPAHVLRSHVIDAVGRGIARVLARAGADRGADRR